MIKLIFTLISFLLFINLGVSAMPDVKGKYIKATTKIESPLTLSENINANITNSNNYFGIQSDIGNIRTFGNSIISTDTNGNINISPDGLGVCNTKSVVPASTNTYDLGSSNLSYRSGYLGTVFTTTLKTNTNYVVLDNDGIGAIYITALSKYVTLPVAANNNGRNILINRFVSGNGSININAAENIDSFSGEPGVNMHFYNESAVFQSDGTQWHSLNHSGKSNTYTLVLSGTAWSTAQDRGYVYKDKLAPTSDTTWRLAFNIAGNTNAAVASYNVAIAGVVFDSTSNTAVSCYLSSSVNPIGCYVTGSTNTVFCYVDGTSASYKWSGDVRLDRKPTFVY